MFRKLLLVVFAVVAASGAFAQSTTLKGTVVDKATGEPIPFAAVVVLSGPIDGTQLNASAADIDGNYTIKPLPPGKWTVRNCIMYGVTDNIISLAWGSHDFDFFNCVMMGSAQDGLGRVFG